MAKRSRGTPRLANRLLKRVRDFAQVKYDGHITGDVASLALDLLEVDKFGLDQTDRNILHDREVWLRACRPGHAGGIHRGRFRNDRGCVRTVSDKDRAD